MTTTFEPGNNKPRVLIVDNNSQFTYGVRELLQCTRPDVVCEENDAR